jgi:acetolactate synthase-1/2/3 large subunit
MGQTGAELLVACLESLEVEYVFGIPGAKVDKIFDALANSKKIKFILCRHEQNATFMASSYGRLSGKPGVVLVTSGPGVSNLTTGLLTATTEAYPVVAIGGNVSQEMLLRQTHQALDNSALMQVVSKCSIEIESITSIPETLINAFRIAMTPTKGACFISIPQNILLESTSYQPMSYVKKNTYGLGELDALNQAVNLIQHAKHPILLLGMNACETEYFSAINDFIRYLKIPVISTFQAAGLIAKQNISQFVGHVGLFRNEPGDLLIESSDLILAIGFDPVEYDPEIWNPKRQKQIIHIGYHTSKVRYCYLPVLEILGDISANLNFLRKQLPKLSFSLANQKILKARNYLFETLQHGSSLTGSRIHPLRFMYELKQVFDEQWTLCCDVGSVYMWFARYFFTHRPLQLLFSNGQQTLGVALPWAIGCHYARPKSRCISISGDGGFLFSAMELETAVREQIPLIHFIWQDGSYDMVKQQQLIKYGRKSFVQLGSIDVVSFAKSFGALGFELNDIDDFKSIFNSALEAKQPVLINVPIDYQFNSPLFKIADDLS